MSSGRPDQPVPPGAVVVGFDRSPVAGLALDWASDYAVRTGRPLAVVYAEGSAASVGTTWLNLTDPGTEPTPVDRQQHGQAVLAKAVARVGLRHLDLGAVPVLTLVDPASELLHLSRTAHLVVLGSRGHRPSLGQATVPTGQIGSWLARRATCPVVVVPETDPATVRQGVLVGIAATDAAPAALDFAGEYAASHDLPLSVVHAAKAAPGNGEARRRWLAEAVGGLAERHPGVHVSTVLLPGRPVATLLRMAERMNLLVVGQHRPTGLHRSPLGHVRSSIVDRSPCPTAVVPAPLPSEERSAPWR